MIHLRYISFLFLTLLHSYEVIDSSLILEDKISQDAVLIPDYDSEIPGFKREFLGKSKKFFIDFDAGYATDNSVKFNFSPYFSGKKFNFKINFDYFINNSDFNHWGPIDVIEKIEYLNLQLFRDKFNLFLGEIKNLSFGHGYLLNNYGNNYNYPIDKKIGINFRLNNRNNSVIYHFFTSSIRDLFNSGSLVGNHLSLLLSDSFPLRFGFGHIIDLNQLNSYRENMNDRTVNAFEIDFDFPIFNQNLLFIGELSGIFLPETRYYQRGDDNQTTNDKKFRNGIWGILFPGIKYTSNNYQIQLAFNYNSALYSPSYFNKVYEFEKIRYREYNINQNELFTSNEAELLENFSMPNTDGGLLLPKDIYSMTTEHENTYPTYGLSSSIIFTLDDISHFDLDYSYYMEFGSNRKFSFNSISMNYFRKQYVIFFMTTLDLFFTKNFFEKSQFDLFEENTIYGFKMSIDFNKKISAFGEFKDTFYDMDLDGSVDKISYLNIGIKLKY